MRFKITYIILILVLIAGCTSNSQSNITGNIVASTIDNPDKVTIYFFWGDGCPHCAREKPFLEEMQQKYPDIEVVMFETWNNPDNANLFFEVAEAYGTTAQGVPTTFIGDEYWVGYVDYMAEEMENKIVYCLENECINPGDN